MTPNEILNLQLKYKNNQEILDLVIKFELLAKDIENHDDIVSQLESSNDSIEDLQNDVYSLEEDKEALQEQIDHLNGMLNSLTNAGDNIGLIETILKEHKEAIR
jgi:peptidoglycan hydrolase CwlO-like protein